MTEPMNGSVCEQGHPNAAEARYCTVCGSPIATYATATEDADLPAELGPDIAAVRQGRGLGRKAIAIAGGAALLVIAIAVVAYFTLTAPVPDLASTPASQSAATLKAAGFEPGAQSKEFSTSVARGGVVSQNPPAGSRSRKGSQVSYVVSRGPAVIVTDVVGTPIASVRKDFKDLGITTDEQQRISETVPKGLIIAQNPAAHTKVEKGDAIKLIVSSGPPVTTLHVDEDLTSLSANPDYEWLDCPMTVILWNANYGEAEIWDENDHAISHISGKWIADPSNGKYLPCYVSADFPNTPTNAESYKVVFAPEDPIGNSLESVPQSRLEALDWTITD